MCLFMCVCTMCCFNTYVHHVLPATCGGQKKALDPLELQLQMVVSLHVGSGNLTQVLWKNSQCS